MSTKSLDFICFQGLANGTAVPVGAVFPEPWKFPITSMLTNKGKYGLKAMVHMAALGPGELALVNDIALANNLPKKFLDAILGDLRNAGLVVSRKGKGGGYRLARPAAEITVGSIVRVLDGPLAPIPCASRTRYRPCDDCDVETCQVRHMMLDVREAIAAVLDQRNLAELRDLGAIEGFSEIRLPA